MEQQRNSSKAWKETARGGTERGREMGGTQMTEMGQDYHQVQEMYIAQTH